MCLATLFLSSPAAFDRIDDVASGVTVQAEQRQVVGKHGRTSLPIGQRARPG